MKSAVNRLTNIEAEFPIDGSETQKIRFLLNYAVLAPSKYNIQPWLFEISGDSVNVICERHGALRSSDPEDRELIMSCGAAIFNFRIAAARFGYHTTVKPFPYSGDCYLTARVFLNKALNRDDSLSAADDNQAGLDPGSGRTDERLFRAITVRRTTGGRFRSTTPPYEVLKLCQETANHNGAWLRVFRSTWVRREIARLVAAADRTQMSNHSFREELAMWIRPADAKSKAGMSAAAYGFPGCPDVLTSPLSLFIDSFNIGRMAAFRDRALAQNSPVLAVLGTAEDSRQAWLAAGQALEAVLLQVTAAGLGVSFLNQPVQTSPFRAALLRAIGGTGFPQALMRLGYGKQGQYTPRRSLDDMVTTN